MLQLDQGFTGEPALLAHPSGGDLLLTPGVCQGSSEGGARVFDT